LTIHDDGIGFDPAQPPVDEKGQGGLGLPGMRERATYVGGTLTVKSVRRAGTEIEIRIPSRQKCRRLTELTCETNYCFVGR
jgi:signal transduction histidine kinase